MQLQLDEEAKNTLKTLKDKIKNSQAGFFDGKKLKNMYADVNSNTFTDVFIAEPDIDSRMAKLERALKSFKYHLRVAMCQIDFYLQGQKKIDGEERLDKLKKIIDNWKQESKRGCPTGIKQLQQNFKEDNMYIKNQLEEMVRQTYVDLNKLKDIDANYYGGKNAEKYNNILERFPQIQQKIMGTAVLDTNTSLEQAQIIKEQLAALRKYAVIDLSQENVDARFRNINESIFKIKNEGNKGKSLSEKDKKQLSVFSDEDTLNAALFARESIALNKQYFKDLTHGVAEEIRKITIEITPEDEEYNALKEYLDQLSLRAEEMMDDPDVTQSDIDFVQEEFASSQERMAEIRENRNRKRETLAQLRKQEKKINSFFSENIEPVLSALEGQFRYGAYNKIKQILLDYKIYNMQELTQQYMSAVLGSVLGEEVGQERKTPEEVQAEIAERVKLANDAFVEKFGASNQPINDRVKQRNPEMPKIEQKPKAPVVDKSGLADIIKRREAKKAAEQKAIQAEEAQKATDSGVLSVNVNETKAEDVIDTFKLIDD